MVTGTGNAAKGGRSLNKLFIGIGVTIVLILGVPAIISAAGWKGAPGGPGWGILVMACFGMVVKLLASESATGEFEFYKFGYDNCVTTMGAVISAFAIQLYSTKDVYPGLATLSFLPTFNKQDLVTIRTIQLALFFCLTWLATLITARICGGIKRGEVNERGLKALVNAFIGPMFLSSYALMLAAKGA
jgi:hypothetical protein